MSSDSIELDSPIPLSAYVKSKGLGSLRQMSELAGVPVTTLRGWYKDEPRRFDIMLLGCLTHELIDKL